MQLTQQMLNYKYSNTVVGGDDPDKRTLDRVFLNRKEFYEVRDFILSFNPKSLYEVINIEKWLQEYKPHERLTRRHLRTYISNKLDLFRRIHL